MPGAKTESPTAFLLSVYDEYISSYKDRRAIVTAEFAEKLVASGNALNHVIVVRGQIVGTWKRTFSKRTVVIEIGLFRRLTDAEHAAVAAAAGRYGKFFGLTATLS